MKRLTILGIIAMLMILASCQKTNTVQPSNGSSVQTTTSTDSGSVYFVTSITAPGPLALNSYISYNFEIGVATTQAKMSANDWLVNHLWAASGYYYSYSNIAGYTFNNLPAGIYYYKWTATLNGTVAQCSGMNYTNCQKWITDTVLVKVGEKRTINLKIVAL